MYLIKDQTKDGQQFPLSDLFSAIMGEFDFDLGAEFRVYVSAGYGSSVCEWDDQLESQDYVLVQGHQLARVFDDPQQWFYDLHVEIKNPLVRFGVLDSSGLFIAGTEPRCGNVAKKFRAVSES